MRKNKRKTKNQISLEKMVNRLKELLIETALQKSEIERLKQDSIGFVPKWDVSQLKSLNFGYQSSEDLWLEKIVSIDKSKFSKIKHEVQELLLWRDAIFLAKGINP